MIKLTPAKEGERPILTERREDAPVATPEVEVTEVTVTTGSDEPNAETEIMTERSKPNAETELMTERSQGIYASEASRPLTLEAMFERMKEEERNTPEYQARAEQAYQEGKHRHMECCRRKRIPHELENEPEELPPSEISKLEQRRVRH